MKKLTTTIALITLISINGLAQIKIGARLGLLTSSLNTLDFTTTDNTIKYQSLSNLMVGVQGGLLVQVKISGMFIQPELLLTSTGGQVEVSNLVNNTSSISNQQFTKLDLPVLVGLKLGPLRLGIGPVGSVILNKPSEALNFSGSSINSKYNNATLGYQAGVGLDLWKIAIDFKYEGNLSLLGNGVNIDGHEYNFDSRNHQWILGVALFF